MVPSDCTVRDGQGAAIGDAADEGSGVATEATAADCHVAVVDDCASAGKIRPGVRNEGGIGDRHRTTSGNAPVALCRVVANESAVNNR